MRSKSLAGHEVGLARLSAKLIAFLEPVLWVGISHGLSVFFAYFTQTKHNQYCTFLLCFRAFRYADIRRNSILL